MAPEGCIVLLGFSECRPQIPRSDATLGAGVLNRLIQNQHKISHYETWLSLSGPPGCVRCQDEIKPAHFINFDVGCLI